MVNVILDPPGVDRRWARAWAQVAWALIKVYAEDLPKPVWWLDRYDAEIERWLVEDATMMRE